MDNTRINILMIDDDKEDFIIVRELIADIDPNKYSLEWAASYKNGLKEIAANNYDICLVDYRLGMEDGLELISEATRNGCMIPLILLTGVHNPEIDQCALQAGASDYLTKGNISSDQLERAIRYGIGRAKKLHEIKALNFDLEKKVAESIQQLDEKNELLKEINHRVKNNLQIITSLLHIYASPLKDDCEKKVFKLCLNKIEIMSMLYNMTYADGRLLTLNIVDFIHNFRDNFLITYGEPDDQFEVKVRLLQQSVSIDTAVVFGLVLNEIIVDPGSICSIPNIPRQIILNMNDDGKGRFVLKINDNYGIFKNDKSGASEDFFSPRLIDGLIEQLDGKCHRTSTEEGVNYAIEFKEIGA